MQPFLTLNGQVADVSLNFILTLPYHVHIFILSHQGFKFHLMNHIICLSGYNKVLSFLH